MASPGLLGLQAGQTLWEVTDHKIRPLLDPCNIHPRNAIKDYNDNISEIQVKIRNKFRLLFKKKPAGKVPLTSHTLSVLSFPFQRREIKKPITIRQRTSRAAMTRPRSAISPGRYPMLEGDGRATAVGTKSSGSDI